MDKNPPLYMAVMPDVFGRGIMCFSHESEEHAKAKVKLAYGEQLPINIPVDIPQEDEQLRQMVADGCAQWDIASALGRGEVDIYYRRRKLGMPPGPWPKSVKYKRLKEAILQANS